MINLPPQKRLVDEGPMLKCFWLLLPAVIVYAICVFYLKAFPLWSLIVEGVSIVAYLIAITVVCLKQKIYMRLVKIYFSVITLGVTMYLMSEVPKWMAQ